MFIEKLLNVIISNISNDIDDNYDYYRFGLKSKKKQSIKQKIKRKFKQKIKYKTIPLNIACYTNAIRLLSPYYGDLCNLYNMLEDDKSKNLLIQLLAYRILGERKIRLPLNTPEYWNGIKKIEELQDSSDYLEAPFVGGQQITLYKYNLNKFSIPIVLYGTANGAYHSVYVGQYKFKNKDIIIEPKSDDIVLDCGACWGGTALFFANDVGELGHVYSFEFIPKNIEVFRKNLSLNKELEKRITLVPKPLGISSNQKVTCIENGPGSRIDFDNNVIRSMSLDTISIDDFVDSEQIKVDFIKMDIEGSELSALKGAEKTIRKFKPQLAISIYHSMNDFVNIPAWLKSLGLGYKLYLGHYTIHNEETVIYARM